MVGMLFIQFSIYWVGYQAVLSCIHGMGGCGKLGSLRYYCGGGIVPGTFLVLPIMLAFVLPPIVTKGLISGFGRLGVYK